MEDAKWKKDETPYLVFQCSSCNQYSYVKTTQKSKNCLRCGRLNPVKSISGEIVLGMTSAVETVKKRQIELAHKELGSEPDLRARNDFMISGTSRNAETREEGKIENNYSSKFLIMLREISKSFKKFPLYVIEVIAIKYSIPDRDLKALIELYMKKGILLRLKDFTFTLQL
ncbi:MAG: hypothetical protein ACFE8N_14860 [Promethearchaeota archaeon]